MNSKCKIYNPVLRLRARTRLFLSSHKTQNLYSLLSLPFSLKHFAQPPNGCSHWVQSHAPPRSATNCLWFNALVLMKLNILITTSITWLKQWLTQHILYANIPIPVLGLCRSIYLASALTLPRARGKWTTSTQIKWPLFNHKLKNAQFPVLMLNANGCLCLFHSMPLPFRVWFHEKWGTCSLQPADCDNVCLLTKIPICETPCL